MKWRKESSRKRTSHIEFSRSTSSFFISFLVLPIGSRQAAINVAEGLKQSTILQSEADRAEQINRASGEAEAILLRAQASAESIRRIADAITNNPGGHHAVSLTVADKYVDAFAQLAKETNTLILPATANDAAGMVAQVSLRTQCSFTSSLIDSNSALNVLRTRHGSLSLGFDHLRWYYQEARHHSSCSSIIRSGP